jgi:hypothetical protein
MLTDADKLRAAVGCILFAAALIAVMVSTW